MNYFHIISLKKIQLRANKETNDTHGEVLIITSYFLANQWSVKTLVNVS